MYIRQIFEYDPDIGYRYIPGLRARIPHESGGYLIRANEMGFRSTREYVAEKPPGVRRVLLFGDSYTAADGVPNERRYSDIIEKRIPGLEIYNFGLPGTGTDQQYLAWRKFAPPIEHDVLMIAVMVENIRRIVARYRVYLDESGAPVCYAKPYFELTPEGLALRQVPPRKEPIEEDQIAPEYRGTVNRIGRFPRLRQFLIKTNLERIAHTVMRFTPYPEYRSPQHPAWKLMEAILETWIRESNKPVLLVPLPLYCFIEEMSPANYQTRFSELALRTGSAYFDPLPDLKRYPLAERRAFRYARDVHPTAAGHEAIARALEPAVRKVLG